MHICKLIFLTNVTYISGISAKSKLLYPSAKKINEMNIKKKWKLLSRFNFESHRLCEKFDSQRQNADGFAFRILTYANFDMIFNNSKFDLC